MRISAIATAYPPYDFTYGELGIFDNDRSMVETARQFAELLGISVAIEITDWHRNLRMDGRKAAAQGITFCSTQEGFARCLREYNLSGGLR